MSEDPGTAVADRISKYEEFVNNRLKGDLRLILENRDNIYNQISEYSQLKSVLEKLQQTRADKHPLTTQIDLGCNFYAKAKVSDPSKVYVSVGFGFFVEFTRPEALKFMDKKTAHLNAQCDELNKDAARIKAHIKLVLEALKELQQFGDSDSLSTKHVDVWS